MNVVCIGGGPAGLYLGILLKLRDPRHRVVIHERNRPAETFGFGVVFSYATLGNLEAADPVSYAELARHFMRWDDIETHVGGQVLRSTGHGFCGLERKQLLLILQARAAELGVEVRFEDEVTSLDEVTRGADVVVAADGVGSWLRERHRDQLGPSVDVRPNKFVWLGTTVPYRAFTFLFKESPYGLFRVHAYPFSVDRSTFIVECRPETWQRAGFDVGDEAHTVAVLEELFAEELGGHPLIRNRSIWRNFPTVRCRTWHSGNLVVVGDAAHTAHFSIGSGTKLAMEDSIELAAALAAVPSVEAPGAPGAPGAVEAVEAALAAYQARRKPDVEALQAAAQASLEWFEGTERVMHLPPAQFAYHLMTRSLRVSHASMRRRDPELAAAVEALLAGADGPAGPDGAGGAGAAGGDPRRTAVRFCGQRLGHRAVRDETPRAVRALGGALGAAPDLGALEALVSGQEGEAVAWGARLVSLGAVAPQDADGALALGEALSSLPAAAWRGVLAVIARSPAELALLAPLVPAGVSIGLQLIDDPARRDELVATAALAMGSSAPPAFAFVRAAVAGGERMAAVPLADRVRNELSLPTLVSLEAATRGEDLDAVIAAGRADLAALPAEAALFRAP